MTQRLDPARSLVIAGVARVDITPPVGIYHRMWGAAKHDRSTGIHRPLTATVLTLAPAPAASVSGASAVTDAEAAPDQLPQIAIALDHCLLWTAEMDALLDTLEQRLPVPRESLHVYFSHTHGAGLLGRERCDLPGGDLIPAYLDRVADEVALAAQEALAAAQPATITYESGRCKLATNRDYLDPASESYVCGFNPDRSADDTLILGRITDRKGKCLATLLNYACHPTTLAWDNTLISPDYVGATREIIEGVSGAPCFFIQGASGDVGPRQGFVGDCEVAETNGRQLGYAALAAWENLLPPDHGLHYAGPVVSGATIGTWRVAPIDSQQTDSDRSWRSVVCRVDLPLRSDLPDRDQLLADQKYWQAKHQAAADAGEQQKAADARAMVERATRRLVRVAHLPSGETFPYQACLWRMGNAIWVPLNGEHYNVLQTELRRRFPQQTLIVGTLVNGSDVWYLPDADSYGKGLYQEEAAILARGSLERLIEALTASITELLAD